MCDMTSRNASRIGAYIDAPCAKTSKNGEMTHVRPAEPCFCHTSTLILDAKKLNTAVIRAHKVVPFARHVYYNSRWHSTSHCCRGLRLSEDWLTLRGQTRVKADRA